MARVFAEFAETNFTAGKRFALAIDLKREEEATMVAETASTAVSTFVSNESTFELLGCF
jgi:hypothetical protein